MMAGSAESGNSHDLSMGFSIIIGCLKINFPIPGRNAVSFGLINIIGVGAVKLDIFTNNGNIGAADHGRGRMRRNSNVDIEGTNVKPRRRTVVDHFEANGVGAQSSVGCLGIDAGGIGMVKVHAVGCIEVPQVFNDSLSRVNMIGSRCI